MVKNSGKKAGPGPIRALNLPGLVEVEEDDAQSPVTVSVRRRRMAVASIEDVWEVLDEWWRARPISRRYYRLVLEEGPSITLFRDLVDGRWYEQRG
jgi:protein ImuB